MESTSRSYGPPLGPPVPLRAMVVSFARATSPARAARPLALACLVLTSLGALELAGAPLVAFGLERPFTVAAAFTSLLFLAAAALAATIAAGPARASSSAAWWYLAALALAITAFDALTNGEARLALRAGVDGSVALAFWLACIGLGATIIIRLVTGPARWLALVGLFACIAGRSVGFAFEDASAAGGFAGAAEMGGAALLLLAVVAGMGRLPDAGAQPAAAYDLRSGLAALDDRLDLGLLGIAVGGCILAFGLIGGLVGTGELQALAFDLRADQTLPAIFGAGLSLLAGGIALLLWQVTSDGSARRSWLAMGTVLILLGAADLVAVHHILQDLTGIERGQVVILPLVAAAFVCWIAILRRLTTPLARRLWILGAGAWVLSQVIDVLQPSGRFVPGVVPEEMFEMSGSALFGFALLITLRGLVRESTAVPRLPASEAPHLNGASSGVTRSGFIGLLGTLALELARSSDRRRLCLWLAATIAALSALSALAATGLSLGAYRLDVGFTVPSIFESAMLLVAAVLIGVLARAAVQRPAEGTWFRLAAVALALLALDALGGVHERVAGRLGSAGELTIPLLLASVPFACAVVVRRFGKAPRLVGAGAVLILAGQLLDVASPTDSDVALIASGAIELCGVALVLVGLVAAVQAAYSTAPRRGGSAVAWSATMALLRGVDPRRLAILVGGCIVALGLAGSAVGAGFEMHLFDLNAEQNVPALFSGGLSLAAGALALLLSRVRIDDSFGRRWWTAIGLVLIFLGLDEITAIHEAIQEETGIHPGQIVLLPLVAVAFAAWLVTLRRLSRSSLAWRLWLGGALAWVVAQAIDLTQPSNQFVASVVPEELLEMAGSAMFLFALLLFARDRLDRCRIAAYDPTSTPTGNREVMSA